MRLSSPHTPLVGLTNIVNEASSPITSYSSAPISTTVEPDIGRVSPSISTVIPTVLSPASLANGPNTCKSVAPAKIGSPSTELMCIVESRLCSSPNESMYVNA